MNEPDAEQWSELKEKGGMLPLMLMLWLYRLGGRFLCRLILYFVILWYWLFAQTVRRASLGYLRQLHRFAGQQSPFQHRPVSTNSYTHLLQFGECILDKIEGWLGRIPEHKLNLQGHENFRAHYGNGAIILVSHFGNIELLRAIKSEHPQKINVLVYQKHATQFNRFLRKLNDRTEIQLISVDELGVETALLLQQKLDQGEWVVIAADRVPVQSDRVQTVRFLGQDASWPQGAWILASLLKVPVLAVFCYRFQQGFDVHIHHVADQVRLARANRLQDMQLYTRQYIALLEQHCMRAPYQWFNFYHVWNK
ncbi:LpxL/LpxP family acyltransferase [Acinetobacter sp. WZC-1]|uniref:LpxL/LpxP family acyltransferase n=1 Tax=Acinetobacter sp. WZC-1 TaxID=3459034 RepID=UPI00403D94A1